MNDKKLGIDIQGYCTNYFDIIQKVIKTPALFYREMPKSGGLSDPLIFMVAMGILAGLIRAILGVAGFGITRSLMMALGSIIIVPIFVAVFGFIGAGVLFIIWKLMGSQEPYETAFRCLAYAGAISPITGVLNAVPYLGAVLGLLWMTYILVNASTEVYHIQARLSWIVFGTICAILSITSIRSQITARNMAERYGALRNQMGQIDKMKPEEAGKAMGEFMKGFQKGSN